jgi:hypothetical protein
VPFVDPAKRKTYATRYNRKSYASRYRESVKFRTSEAKRKALWYAEKASDPAWLAEMAARKRESRGRKAKGSKT